ncbi:MAG: endonuclease/exonuclease/phosphatase family protein [Chlamydiia bacterium]|nr:endonuclease/exonuclease/phosphatase family protein [Chlamydiia bacterium]
MKTLLSILALALLYACAPSSVVPIDANPFVHLTGMAPDLEITDQKELSIVTWNVLGLPDFLVATKPWKDRVDGMAKLLLEIDADLIILQEVFEPELAKSLFERLKGRYAHAYLHLNTNLFAFSSGLAIFSKPPISNFRFTPHPNLLCAEKWLSLGTADFCLLNHDQKVTVHIAAGHFQGSSRYSWRQDITDGGQLLTYAEARQEQSKAAIELGAYLPATVPRYLCGDLNVDRCDAEYNQSVLNPLVAPIHDPMPKEMRQIATSTTFFKHYDMLWKTHPTLSASELLSVANALHSFKKLLAPQFEADFWKSSVSNVNLEQMQEQLENLKKHIDLSNTANQLAWNHFVSQSLDAFEAEINAIKSSNSTGQVNLNEIIEVHALPFDEALDYILGIGKAAHISEIKILSGYSIEHPDEALSDHHPIYAKIGI